MKMRTLLGMLLVFSVFFSFAASVDADTSAVSFDQQTTTYSNTIGGGSFGFVFTPTEDLLVTQLGFFDDWMLSNENGDPGKEGLVNDHFVGIYDAASLNLLAGTTVAADATWSDYFRYSTLAEPVSLSAGSPYYILADIGVDNYADALSGYVLSGIDGLEAAFYDGSVSGTSSPLDGGSIFIDGGDGYFGPNFRSTPVPIPGGLWLLGSGVVFLIACRQRSFLSR